MKANELMIGDWVECTYWTPSKQLKVAEIRRIMDDEIKIGVYSDDLVLIFRQSEVKPIPITPDILEKNGWIKDGYFYRAKDGSYIQLGQLFEHATFSCEKYGINREVFTSPSMLKYVHQLQHALRLCGISKEIEL